MKRSWKKYGEDKPLEKTNWQQSGEGRSSCSVTGQIVLKSSNVGGIMFTEIRLEVGGEKKKKKGGGWRRQN